MNTSPVFIYYQTDNFEEFCENAKGYELDFEQLESGRFFSELLMFGDHTALFASAKLGRKMHQNGASPEGLMTFGLMANSKSSTYWRNLDIYANRLFVFPPGRDFHSISPSNFDVILFSLHEEKLNQLCESFELPSITRLVNYNEVFLCDPQLHAELRNYLLSVKYQLINDTENSHNIFFLKEIEQELARRFVNLLANKHNIITKKPIRKRDLGLRAVNNYIIESNNAAVTVADLCRVANVSERTLEYAFREYFGITPKAYTLIHRLNSIHKQLRLANPDTTFVYEIAQQQDFWHMGKFSSDYKKLFGVLPSQTLAAK